MFYSYKDFVVNLNQKEILCNSCEISQSAQVDVTAKEIDATNFNSFVAKGPMQGSLRLSYYVTGRDDLKSYIEADTSITGNFGGLYFASGYLNQYSINCLPNNPVLAQVDLKFFESLKGQFVPPAYPTPLDVPVLNFSDVTIDTLSSYSMEPITNITSLSYTFAKDINATYLDDNRLDSNAAYRISFGERKIVGQLVTDSLLPNLPPTGLNAGVSINFNAPSNPSLVESLTISGRITQKTISVSAGDILKNSISISQIPDRRPNLSSFFPSQGNVGDPLTIFGENLDLVQKVTVGGVISPFTILDPGTIATSVPIDGALFSPLSITSIFGTVNSSQNFNTFVSTVVVVPDANHYGQPS